MSGLCCLSESINEFRLEREARSSGGECSMQRQQYLSHSRQSAKSHRASNRQGIGRAYNLTSVRHSDDREEGDEATSGDILRSVQKKDLPAAGRGDEAITKAVRRIRFQQVESGGHFCKVRTHTAVVL
jgi:hypothetical protein